MAPVESPLESLVEGASLGVEVLTVEVVVEGSVEAVGKEALLGVVTAVRW
jgi:hypothetical protein